MRAALTYAHRWVGLLIAAFLFVSGLTGAVISWDNELDAWLNPHLTRATASGSPQPSVSLARQFEARNPQARVTFVPMSPEPGRAVSFYVLGRVDAATGKPVHLPYNQVFIDPVSGEELGRREWGQVWPLSTETIVSFLYKLHYTLHIPEMWGIDDWGVWLMGGVAILWTVDCFVGFYLTLPLRHRADAKRAEPVRRKLAKSWWSRWKPAWLIKTSGSPYRINFDIHRAIGLWTWILLVIVAFTGFSLNLHREIFFPVVSSIATVTPTPFETLPRAPKDKPVEPKVSYEEVYALAVAEGRRRAWSEPVGALRYRVDYGMYDVRFFAPGDDHGAAGLGPRILYFSGTDGSNIGDWQPFSGTAADIFVKAQFPLHSGRIAGLPGRILVSVMGIVVAALAVTGVVIWLRKRRARLARRAPVARVAGHASPAE